MMPGFGQAKHRERDQPKASSASQLIQEAVRFHKAGDLAKAERLYLLAIDAGITHEIAFTNLGVIYKQTGRFQQAIDIYKRAIAVNPMFAEAYANLGNLYKNIETYELALPALLKAIELKPGFVDAYVNLAALYFDTFQPEKALQAARRAVQLGPDHSDAHMIYAGILRAQGYADEALKAAHKVLHLQPLYSDAYLAIGSILQEQGLSNKALAATRKAIHLNPSSADAYSTLSGILKEKRYYVQALAAAQKAIALDPANADAYMNLAGIRKEQGFIEESDAATDKAAVLTLRDCSRLTYIFDHFDSRNRNDRLAECIAHCKQSRHTSGVRTQVYESRLAFKEARYLDSLQLIRAIDVSEVERLDPFSKLKYHNFRALAEDRAGQYDIAFHHYAFAQKDPRYKQIDHLRIYERIDDYMRLSKTMSRAGRPTDSATPEWSPVFLIGFPRSGTTLLDTILRSHPSIRVVEEKDPLAHAEAYALKQLGRSISELNDLTKPELDVLRSVYRRRLEEYVSTSSGLIIDKLPLHTIRMPLIHLLFPHAKLIFAIRHPCDSVLSCFQQLFKPNTAMANFVTLDKSILFYDKVMSAWRAYLDQLRVDPFVCKYEDLVDDFTGTAARVVDYLGLEWSDNVENYRQTALDRGYIATPSSSQVVQPIYKTSVQKWKNYQKFFVPRFNIIEPWISYWGYSCD